jgi:hypothetical protein
MGRNMFEPDLSFPHTYRLTEPPELPGSGTSGLAIYYYPPPSRRPERDGLWVRCSPQFGSDWVGVFAGEYGSPPATSKILSTPDPDRVCVISAGRGYIVNCSKPTEWEAVPIFPITYASSVPAHRFLVFGTFSRLIAWNDKVVWQADVAIDGLTVTSLTSDRIEGYGYDPRLGVDDPFVIETGSGRFENRCGLDDSLSTPYSLLPTPYSLLATPCFYSAVPHPVQNRAPGGFVFWQFGHATTIGAGVTMGCDCIGTAPAGTAAGFQIGTGIPSDAAIAAA